MRRILTTLTTAFALSAASAAFCQSNPKDPSTTTNSGGSVTQPQGETGPINTGSGGGAPASSPQGETPPGMQSAPKGYDKTIRPDGTGTDVLEGTPNE